jgi:hypothetical protein
LSPLSCSGGGKRQIVDEDCARNNRSSAGNEVGFGRLWPENVARRSGAFPETYKGPLKMNKIALLVAAVGVAGFTGGAFAQASATSPGAGAPAFDVADANHDGFVDFTEAVAAYPGLDQNNFDQVDTNKDGKLTADEYNQLGGEGQYNSNNNASASQ